MTEKEIKRLVEEQLRREIGTTWAVDMAEYFCCISGSPQTGSMLAEFTRKFSDGARIEVNEVYADDQGVLLQWGIPNLL